MSHDNAVQIRTFTGAAIAEAHAAFQVLHVAVFVMAHLLAVTRRQLLAEV